MLIPYDLRLFPSNGYPGFGIVLGWILVVLLLLVSFAIMVSRIHSSSDLPDSH